MTLDLPGVRQLVRRLAERAEVRWADREPYPEHAARVEARLAAAGAGQRLRMAAWLCHVPGRFGQTGRDLRAAGVPARVVQLVAAMRRPGYPRPLGDHPDALHRAGAAPVVRADLAEVLAAARPGDLETRRSALALLAALDVADPDRRLDVASLLAGLERDRSTDAWWYAVAALGRSRRAEVVPALLAAYRAVDEPDPTRRSVARHAVLEALAQVMTGSEHVTRYIVDAPPPKRAWEPLLLEIAGRDRDERLREFAVLLLRRLRDPAHVPLFAGLLADARRMPSVAAAAARALGEAAPVEVAPADRAEALIDVLADEGLRFPWPREEAARALGRVGVSGAGTGRVVEVLTAALADPAPAVVRAAARSLVAIGAGGTVEGLRGRRSPAAAWALGELRARSAVPELVGWLREAHASGDPGMVASCAEALGKIGAVEAAGVLAGVASGPHPFVRRAAVWALGRTDPGAGIEALLCAAADPDPDVRREAARALARCGDRRAVAGLLAVLREGPGEAIVLRALARRPDPRAAPAVLAVFERATDRRTRRLAGEALVALATYVPAVAGQVEAHLYGTDPHLVRAALGVLGRLGDPRRASSVADRLRDADEITRARAAAALGRLGPPGHRAGADPAGGVAARLRAAVDDPAPRVRANAVTAIGAWRGKADVALLRRALRDPHRDVRAAAGAALRRLHPGTHPAQPAPP